jgi:transcription termination/antitermination protein NusG
MRVMLEAYCWYALHVKRHKELEVAGILKSEGYETFVPSHRVTKKWSDRTKKIDLPLFPSYAFCRFDPELKFTIVSTPSVLRIVGFGSAPVPISAEEIDSLKIASERGYSCQPHPFLLAGQKVRVVAGPLSGVNGIFLSRGRQNRIVLSVDLLRASAVVEIDDESVVVARDS